VRPWTVAPLQDDQTVTEIYSRVPGALDSEGLAEGFVLSVLPRVTIGELTFSVDVQRRQVLVKEGTPPEHVEVLLSFFETSMYPFEVSLGEVLRGADPQDLPPAWRTP
jgi:hypothetical protein